MKGRSEEALLKKLNWRYAVKQFDAQKKIPDSLWQTLAESIRLSASSYGLQPWKFILVKNQEIRKKLREASMNQTQVVDCSHFLVLASLKTVDASYIDHYISEISKVRNIPLEQLRGFRDVVVSDVTQGSISKQVQIWTQKQIYLVMGSLLVNAAHLEIDACPMEGLIPSEYDQILNLKNSPFSTVVAVALGYRSEKDIFSQFKKVRFPLKQVFEVIQ